MVTAGLYRHGTGLCKLLFHSAVYRENIAAMEDFEVLLTIHALTSWCIRTVIPSLSATVE